MIHELLTGYRWANFFIGTYLCHKGSDIELQKTVLGKIEKRN